MFNWISGSLLRKKKKIKPAVSSTYSSKTSISFSTNQSQDSIAESVKQNLFGDAHPDLGPSPKPQWFSLEELTEATSNFNPRNVIGGGNFGDVYLGMLHVPVSDMDLDPMVSNKIVTPVAIKKLNPAGLFGLGFLGQDQWLVEVSMLRQLRHPNLVKLLGWYGDKSNNILVYEYYPNRSLNIHLFPRKTSSSSKLRWETRLKIVFQICQSIAYLHSKGVIHRDLKSSNVLLDENFNAYLSDFGLAKEGPLNGNTHVTTKVLGSLGYVDPSYATTGHLTKASDVYSFGVLVLEILTGKRAVDITLEGRPVSLVTQILPSIKQSLSKIFNFLDPSLPEPFPQPVAKKLSLLAKHCLIEEGSERPTIDIIYETLLPLCQKYVRI